MHHNAPNLCFLLFKLALLPFTWANYYVDDTNSTIQYTATNGNHWFHYDLSNHSIQYTPSMVYYETYTWSNFCPPSDSCSMAIPFTGSGITIYGFLYYKYTNPIVLIDGQTAPAPPAVSPIPPYGPDLNVSLYDIQSLPLTSHVLTMLFTNSSANNSDGSQLYFDYAYVNEVSPSPTSPMIPGSSTPSATSSHSHFPVKALIGGVVAGLVVVAIIAFTLLYFWRKRYAPVLDEAGQDHRQFGSPDLGSHLPHSPQRTAVSPLGRRRMGCRLLLPTIGILISTAGLGLALISYLLAKKIPSQTLHEIVFVNGSLYADEGTKTFPDGQQKTNLQGLLITAIIGHLISFSVPMIMSMVAFRLAANWVSHGPGTPYANDEYNVLPTPQQYGLLLNVCSSASFGSLYQSVSYIFASRSGKPTTSSLIIQASAVLAIISTLSVGIGLADTWMHAATTAVLYSSMDWAAGDALSAPAIAYGTGFNTTACTILSETTPLNSSIFCGQGQTKLWSQNPAKDLYMTSRAYAVAGNISKEHRVTTLNDEDWMAIVTRPEVPGNTVYTARSFGLTNSCVSLTSGCSYNMLSGSYNCSNLGPDTVSFPGDSGLNGLNSFQPWKSGIRLAQGIPLVPQQENSNLFNALVELYYIQPGAEGVPPNNALAFSGFSNGTYVLFANCSFAAYDIVIRASGGNVSLVAQYNASDETTGRLWPALLWENLINSALIGNTEGVVLSSGSVEEVMTDLSQEFARLTLAAAAAIMAPIPSDSAGVFNSRLVSAYPFVPLALFLGLLFIYSIIVIALFVWCASVASQTFEVHTSGEKPYTITLIQLVQMRLTNPLSFVATIFDPPSSHYLDLQRAHGETRNRLLSLQTDAQKLFDESKTTARLQAGFTAPSEENGSEVPQFEIRQRPIGRSLSPCL